MLFVSRIQSCHYYRITCAFDIPTATVSLINGRQSEINCELSLELALEAFGILRGVKLSLV